MPSPFQSAAAVPAHEPRGTTFFAAMNFGVIAIVLYGFSHTVGRSLLHPAAPPSKLLLGHVTLAGAWLLLLAVQSALVRLRRIAWHRRLGLLAGGLGLLLPVFSVALKCADLRREVSPDPQELAFVAVTLNDMLCFGGLFLAGLCWRRRPDFHRRLMLLAACCLTVPAFARMPPALVHAPWWYLYADALILVSALRDLWLQRRLHPVHAWALPVLLLGQGLAMALFLRAPPAWVAVVRAVLARVA